MRIRKQFIIPANEQADPVFEEARKFATSGIFGSGTAITISVEAEADGVSRARTPVTKATSKTPARRRAKAAEMLPSTDEFGT